MRCSNHPNVEADARCEGCAEPFCPSCVVEIQGKTYCRGCKVLLIKDRPHAPRKIINGRIPETTYITLASSVAGLLCCCIGIILHPLALVLSFQAIKEYDEDPDLSGKELVRAAQLISVVALLFMLFEAIASLIATVFMAP